MSETGKAIKSQAVEAYRERIKQAVWSETDYSWDGAAKVMYETHGAHAAPDQQWVYETLPEDRRKVWRLMAFAICDYLAERLGATAELMSKPEETSESEFPNANTRRCIDAYKRRIYDAIGGPADAASFWDKAAAKLRYDYRKAFGLDTSIGFASLPDHEKNQWRDAACSFATWIAEQLGETVVDAKPEDFQDDERKLLDVKLGLAPQKQKQEPPKRPRVVTPRALFDAFVKAGIFRKDDFVQRVVIDIKWDAAPVMHVEYSGDERLLNVVQTLAGIEISKDAEPTSRDFESWADSNPQAFQRLMRQWDRMQGRRVR